MDNFSLKASGVAFKKSNCKAGYLHLGSSTKRSFSQFGGFAGEKIQLPQSPSKVIWSWLLEKESGSIIFLKNFTLLSHI